MGVSSLLDTNATVRHLGADQLPLTIRHAECAGSLTWEHRDPFDRMLVAQAACEDLTPGERRPAGATRARRPHAGVVTGREDELWLR